MDKYELKQNVGIKNFPFQIFIDFVFTFDEFRFGLVWLFGFYGISTFVGYLTPNPFLCK